MKQDTVIDLEKWNVYAIGGAMGDLRIPLIAIGLILLSFVVVRVFGAWWKNGN